LIALCLVIACDPDDGVPNFDVSDIEGMVPIYESEAQISLHEPKSINQAGRFIFYNNLIFITEIGEGVHVIDNSDKTNPVSIAFIKIIGNTDLAIRNDIVYANNGPDLVSFTFANETLTEISRVREVYFSYAESQEFPLRQSNVYFQCPEPERGRILYWNKEIIAEPNCYKK